MEHILEEKLEKLGIQINDIQRKQFDDFYQLLIEWNKVMNLTGVFCKHFLEKNAKYFWRMLHLQIGESCKASAGSYSASYIAIADHI